jgi:hypothetical protein
MGEFFNYLDHVCKKLGVSVICCHHHSKGGQAQKSSIDRASGSGVFARDPDALMDMIRIDPRDVGKSLEKGETAWRISSTLREFESPEDIDVIFSHPIHRITEELKDAEPMYGAGSSTNSARGNYEKKKKSEDKFLRLLSFVENWDEIDTSSVHHSNPSIMDAVEYFKSDKGFSKNTIRNWAKEHPDELVIDAGMLIIPSKNPN